MRMQTAVSPNWAALGLYDVFCPEWMPKVVEAEGPAILMWFLEEAQRGYQELAENGSFMGDTVEVGLELARAYRLKANPHWQWIEQEMIEVPGAAMPAKDAWYSYLEWGDRQGMWKRVKKESYDEFQTAMRTLGFTVKVPTSHHQGKALQIHGLRDKTFSAAEMKSEVN